MRLLILTLAVVLSGPCFANSADRAYLERIAAESARQQGLPTGLVFALIQQESGWQTTVTSPAGARGIMQFMPATARRFGLVVDGQTDERVVPEKAIPAGCRLLRYLLDLYGWRVDLALAGYNAGEGNVEKAGFQVPRIRETQNYVASILARYSRSGEPVPRPSPVQQPQQPSESLAEVERGLTQSSFVVTRN